MSLLAPGTVLRPFLSPTSIFRDDVTALPAASKAEIEANQYAEKLANQLYYGTLGQSGKFYGYSGEGFAGKAEGFAVNMTVKESTVPIYVMDAGAPRIKIWLVKEEGAEETLDEGAERAALRAGYSSVPLPNPAVVLHGTLPSGGSDSICAVWCPATDEFWEIRRLSKFASGAHVGQWKATIGGYLSAASQSNGVYPTGTGNFMGNSASGLVRCGGVITVDDLIRVLRGGKIGHALAITAPVCSGFLAPATRNDTRENTTEFQKDGVTPNPAKGFIDAVPEGLRLRFPPASRASEFSGMTGVLAAAIYEAIREHGLIVRDNGPECVFNLVDLKCLTVGYPHINPVAGSTSTGNTATQFHEYVTEVLETLVSSSWTDLTLPVLKEDFHTVNATYLFNDYPWRSLEQVAPSAS
jgi:hypothetical protein